MPKYENQDKQNKSIFPFRNNKPHYYIKTRLENYMHISKKYDFLTLTFISFCYIRRSLIQ